MAKVKKKNKLTIIGAVILSIILVVIGIIITPTENIDNKPEEELKVKNNRCVDEICVSEVLINEINGSKSVSVFLKNEGKKTIENECVNLVLSDKKYTICLNDVKANEELELSLEYSETNGNTIEDYRLEKASNQEAQEANKKRDEIINNLK